MHARQPGREPTGEMHSLCNEYRDVVTASPLENGSTKSRGASGSSSK